jgi:predicted protein tyrosine phosphatase
MIYVCGIAEMPDHVSDLGACRLLSLVSPAEQPPRPATIAAEHHHRVQIHDITEPLEGHVLPEAAHVVGLIDFVAAWPANDGPLLIHCIAGVSRSTAAALITLVIKSDGREGEAARHLRQAAAHAWPNRRMIALADDLLGCDGALVAAREAMGPADIAFPTPLARIPLLD